MTFESVHDMAYPIDALRKMKEMVSENGAVLVGDVKMKEKVEEKNDFAGRLYYNFIRQFIEEFVSLMIRSASLSTILWFIQFDIFQKYKDF
jgi:hypothetical protein